LVADDNRNIQKVVTLALKDQGIEVMGVGHGEAAVKQLGEFQPDLVLADVFMPVRNGYEVCEYVKNNDQYSHIPVILLFGAFDPVDQKEVQRVRADGMLKKPFEQVGDLVTMVHMMLQKSAKARPATPKADSGMEKTIKLTAEEMQRITAADGASSPEAAPEAEMEDFAIAPPKIEFQAEEQPMAFGDLLGGGVAAEEETPAPEAEFASASSVEEPVEPPVAAREPSAWDIPETPTAESPVEEAASETPVEEEVPNIGGIETPPRQPAPDEPPIAVEFGNEAPPELVRDEEVAPTLGEAGPSPELAASATEFMEATSSSADTSAAAAPSFEVAAPEESIAEAAPPAQEIEAPERPIERLEIPSLEESPVPAATQPGVGEPSPPAAAFPTGIDQAMLEAVVEKVMARLDAGILDKITREVIRPIVEAVVASEFENKK
jgi:CheY-like chemotaxis protein